MRTPLAAWPVFPQRNGALPDPGLPGRDVGAWEALDFDVAASRTDRSALTKRLKKRLRGNARP